MSHCDGCGLDKGGWCSGCACWSCWRAINDGVLPSDVLSAWVAGVPWPDCKECAAVRAAVRRARLGPRVGDRVRRASAGGGAAYNGTVEAMGEWFQAQVCWGDGRREAISRDAIECERQGGADRGVT